VLLYGGVALVAIGLLFKSALAPFHVWTPDVYQGAPTPVTALMAACTKTAAFGALLRVLYVAFDGVRWDFQPVLGVVAVLTMLTGAVLAVTQTDLKRLLAYSTLSQVAIMLSALAAAPRELGPVAGISHLIGHAFFKALLFLGAGWLSVLAGGTAVAALRGRLRPTGALRWSMGIGLAALAGVPPLIGFFTKDTVIDAALEGATSGGGLRAWLVVVALFVTVALTAAYCTRAWLLLDTPPAASRALPDHEPAVLAPEEVGVVTAADSADDAEVERVHAHGHRAITFPAALVVSLLAGLTVVGTLLLSTLRGGVQVGLVGALLSLLLVAVAAYAVWSLSHRGRSDVAERVPVHVREPAVRGFGADTAYAGVGRAVTAVARLVVALDRDVVDAYPRGTAVVARAAGRAGERGHRAVPSLSLLSLLVGVVLVAVLGVAAWR
jgi:NADH-quinone oxidoreductase subunit L